MLLRAHPNSLKQGLRHSKAWRRNAAQHPSSPPLTFAAVACGGHEVHVHALLGVGPAVPVLPPRCQVGGRLRPAGVARGGSTRLAAQPCAATLVSCPLTPAAVAPRLKPSGQLLPRSPHLVGTRYVKSGLVGPGPMPLKVRTVMTYSMPGCCPVRYSRTFCATGRRGQQAGGVRSGAGRRGRIGRPAKAHARARPTCKSLGGCCMRATRNRKTQGALRSRLLRPPRHSRWSPAWWSCKWR